MYNKIKYFLFGGKMVRKIKNNDNIINYEEFKENKSEYEFLVTKPLKSVLKLDNPCGQGKKIERLTKQLHLRIGELEDEVLEIGSKEKNISKSDLVRFLILQFGKESIKKKIEKNYHDYLNKYNDLIELIEEKKSQRELLRGKRGTDKKTANQLCYKRTKLKYEIENIQSKINHLEIYLARYEVLFSK